MADGKHETPDALDNIGQALYTIGFRTKDADKIDLSKLNCGLQEEPKSALKKLLREFREKVLKKSFQHPLEALGSLDHQPELVLHQIDRFNFRAKLALSCLWEKGQGQGLLSVINRLTSTIKREITLLDSILKDKIQDIGNSLQSHSCLSDFKS